MPSFSRAACASRSARCATAFAIGAAAALASCYPGDPLTTEDAEVVVTLFDDRADFASKQSYAMPDSIVHIVVGTEADTVDRDFDGAILAQVASNLGALGFTREGDPADADVLMLVAAASSPQTGYTGYSWGAYWGWYDPYPPGWGWGWYPWYGGFGTRYTYRTGTLFLQMLDPAAADSTEKKVPTIWIGALNGIVADDADERRIRDGIHQAFAQSPYLGEGK